MPQVIENGYLYIAQPPLFKVKKGRTEKYIQNETEMQNMLFELAADDLEMPVRGQAVKGKALIPHLKRLSKFEKLMEWFNRRRKDPDVLKLILKAGVNKEILKNQKAVERLSAVIQKEVPNIIAGEVNSDEEHQAYSVEIKRHNSKILVDTNFLSSPEFKELENLYGIIKDLGEPPYKAETKEGLKELNSSTELLEHVFAVAKKGLTIQRYKGLGEMNPSQLWETTMDSEKRTLLQVTVEDSVQADEIFTILMGDQVEPRKDFITKHALEARNIDI